MAAKNKKLMDFFKLASVGVSLGLFVFIIEAGCATQKQDNTELKKIDRMYKLYSLSFPGIQEISAATLMEWRGRDGVIVLVDNREPEEREISIIPGAFTVDEFEARKKELKENKVVVYCTIGSRSGNYTKDLKKEGFDAYNLKGGILAWLQEGGELVDPAGETTNRVHVYGPIWDLAPPEYKAIW